MINGEILIGTSKTSERPGEEETGRERGRQTDGELRDLESVQIQKLVLCGCRPILPRVSTADFKAQLKALQK